MELNERVVGFNERDKMFWQKISKLFAYVLTALVRGKKQYKGRDLMPEAFPAHVFTEEEKQAELEEIKEMVGLDH